MILGNEEADDGMASVEELVDNWRRIIVGEHKSWVLFARGTVVVLVDPVGDLAGEAVGILREYGPVYPGSSAGDFSTIDLTAAPGWAVTCHHPDMLTYVAPEDVTEVSDVVVGLTGRAKRDQDGRELTVVHVEDARP